MKTFETGNIRTVAVVGHGGCGKTSLVSSLLFAMGATKTRGLVDEGSAPTDFDPEEIERKISIQTAVAAGEWARHKVNLIDAPGYANFLGDALYALSAADAALIVVDAVAGPEVQTDRMYRAAEQASLPRLLIVNRMDRDRASFGRTMEALRQVFGRAVVPVGMPLGEEAGFRGLVDLITATGYAYRDDDSGVFAKIDLEPGAAEGAGSYRQVLVEQVAESDESLMAEFFDSGTLAPDSLRRGLQKAVAVGSVVPVFPVSAGRQIGIAQLLDLIVGLAPAPSAARPRSGVAAPGEETRPADPSAPASAFVFKTLSDPHAGRLSFVRVVSGRLSAEQSLANIRRDSVEKVGALSLALGKQLIPATELVAGDIGVIAKLKDTHTGDTLSDKAHPIRFPPPELPEATTTFAFEPKSRADEERIGTALHRLMEEDPVLRHDREAETHEMLLRGLGRLHIETVVARLAKRYRVEVTLKRPTVPYRETIRSGAEGHGRHKKQTGGHGQFADCKIRMRPLPRGADFKFVDATFGGSIPRNYLPAIEKGVLESRARGVVAGCPLVDFEVEVFDGQYHDVDSSEMAFKIAGSLAFKDAVARCRPTLLEPIMSVDVTVPEEFAGSVMGDLSSRRGRPQGMEPFGHSQRIHAEVPLSEMQTFDQDLTSMTGGRGSFHMEMLRYDEVPGHLQDRLIADLKARKAGVVKEDDEA
jgi:elongation factor G